MKEKIKLLSGAQLKYIAFASMLIDHVNKTFFIYFNSKALIVMSELFDILGRIAFPIFISLLVEGYFKTRNRWRYLGTLLVFGIISEVPFDMCTSNVFFEPNWNNIMFTLALVLAMIWIIDALKKKMQTLPKFLWYLVSFIIVAVTCLIAMNLSLDYDSHAVLIGYFLYLFHDRPIIAIPFNFASMYKEPWALLGFGLMLTYNGIEDGIKAALAAVTVILFKLEGRLIKAHPEYEMSDRLLLGQMDDTKNKVMIEGEWVTMNTNVFPTVDLENPYELTEEETEILRKLHRNFVSSQRLQKHIRFLYEKGSMYNVYNGNLIYHGCVPVDKNGAFDKLCIDGKYYHGKALLDKCEEKARAAYLDNPDKDDIDFMWFLWGGEKSPLCGRKLKTFEREYVDEESLWTEESNPYYSKYYDESFCCQILHEFGLYDDDSHIINGHTPVHAIEGENPVRAKGRLFVIDGGFCRSMNKATGIAGYTLIFNSHGLRLKAHTPFTSVEDALMNNTDIESSSEIIEKDLQRMFVKDTDIGKHLLEEISDLRKLLENYRRL